MPGLISIDANQLNNSDMVLDLDLQMVHYCFQSLQFSDPSRSIAGCCLQFEPLNSTNTRYEK